MIVLRLSHDEHLVAALEVVLDAAHDRADERIGDVGDDEADRVGPTAAQPTGDGVDPVAELLGSRAQAEGKGTRAFCVGRGAPALSIDRRVAVVLRLLDNRSATLLVLQL